MNSSSRAAWWTSAVALALAIEGTAIVSAQTPQHDRRPASSRQGDIKVSGYWTIDVRNADGSLASHTEFENALTGIGGALLGRLVFGNAAAVALMLELAGSNDTCTILPSWLLGLASPPGGPSSCYSTNLTLTSQTAGEPRLVLNGMVTTRLAGPIQAVRTLIFAMCPDGQPQCGLSTPALGTPLPVVPFTEFALTSPIAVQSGQVVTVMVTLSFSS